jgi:hypothetical protein
LQSWSFPSSFEALWKSLPESTKATRLSSAVMYVKSNGSKADHPIIRQIAHRLNTRERTVFQFPADKILGHARRFCDHGDRRLLSYVFGTSLFEAKDGFYDLFDKPSRLQSEGKHLHGLSKLETCVVNALRKFPEEDVRLAVQFLALDKPAWSQAPHIDFTVIEKALQEPEAPQTEQTPALEDNPMPEPPTALALEESIGRLRATFAENAAALRQSAEQLAAGILPPPTLQRDLSGLQADVEELHLMIVERLHSLGEQTRIESNAALTGLEDAIKRIASIENARSESQQWIERAVTMLDTILSLRSPQGSEIPGLVNCRRDAADLRVRLERLDRPESSDLPRNDLLVFEKISEVLLASNLGKPPSDPQAADQVAAVYGVNFAIGLGRWIVASTDSSDRTQPEPSIEVSADAGTDQEITEAPLALESEHPESNQVSAVETMAEAPSRASSEAEGFASPDTSEPVKNSPGLPNDGRAEVATDQAGDASESHPLGVAAIAAETLVSLAGELQTSSAISDVSSLSRLVWQAWDNGRESAAYQLAKCIDEMEPGSSGSLAIRLRSMILGLTIRNPLGAIADQLKVDFSVLASRDDADSEEAALANRLLMISAALRPAVLAPDTNAKALLEIGSRGLPGMDRLYWLVKQIGEYALLQNPLDIGAFASIDSSVSLTQRSSALQSEVKNWRNRALLFKFKYQPAAMLWKQWLEQDGPVDLLIQPVLRADHGRLHSVKAALEKLSSEARIRSEINHSPIMRNSLNWTELTKFTRHVRDAVDLARRWVDLQEIKSVDQLDYRRKKLLELRTRLDSAKEDVFTEVLQALDSTANQRVAAALKTCHRSVQNLLDVFHSRAGGSTVEPESKYLLSGELLLVPGIAMNDRWESELDVHRRSELLVSLLAHPPADWHEAKGLLSENRRDHEMVDRVCEYLAWEGKHEELLEQLKNGQESHLKQCLDSLLLQIEKCKEQVEQGTSLGLVRDHERSAYLDRLYKIESRKGSIRNFEKEENELRQINAAIAESRYRQVAHVRARLARESSLHNSAAAAHIEAALERGDVDTANEQIDLALRGDDILQSGHPQDAFEAFFPEAASKIDFYLDQPANSASFATSVAARKQIPGIDLRNVPEARINEAVALAEAWVALKKSKRGNSEAVSLFLQRLGFNVVTTSNSSAPQRTMLSALVEPLRHRDQCPVPYFGSTANGHYRIICLWDRPSDEEIINSVRHGRQGSPAIVLYFGRLNPQKRRSLAQLSRMDNLHFLLIDEIMMAYLCGEHGSRLSAFFNCVLPFTFINPYTTTSSNVPPEMFYGRHSEREQITDAMGSCFVYGGRQLGKTALLLSIREQFHHPEEHRIALWIDLRSDPDDIWTILSRAFKDLALPDLPIGEARSEQRLQEKLRSWLAVDSRRRILLLLDEADRFLEDDANKDFARTSSLKRLMEHTDRRFKVVFAGLHNVQRATRQQNHPLAHFGEPICVGPLLDNDEWKEARALIDRPFHSIGFRFDSPDLVIQILSRTNYYPSLIQLYCNQIYLAVKQTRKASGPDRLIASPRSM